MSDSGVWILRLSRIAMAGLGDHDHGSRQDYDTRSYGVNFAISTF